MKRAIACGGILLMMMGCLTEETPAPTTRYVDEFDLSAASCGLGKHVQSRRSVDGHPLTISGKQYERGFGTRPESAVAFAANGKVVEFYALVGIDDDAKAARAEKSFGQPTASFFVWADGRIVWSAKEVKLGQKPVAAHVNLTGAREIVLETRSGGPWTSFEASNGDWLEARFTCAKGGKIDFLSEPELYAQLGILTPPEKAEPQFNGADIWGVRPGNPVIYRVPVSGIRPMRFTADKLPAGVTLDAQKGILGGVAPKERGNYDITITAENAKGKAKRVIRLAVGDKIALTPPMGWNSWNVWCYRLTDEHVRESARAMQESGLGDYGWAYVNLDDWWMMNNSGCERVEMRKRDFGGREDVIGPARDAAGRILPNRSFPDMKGLTDYIHSFGFKAGIYSSPGPMTCGKCEGSYGHELQDAESWAEWGFDYLKHDWCHYCEIFEKENDFKVEKTGDIQWDEKLWNNPKYRESFIRPYRLMGECLKKQPRDIVYALCQYGMDSTQEWGEQTGGNCWRSYGDLHDNWAWMELAIDSRIDGEYWKYSHPGWWADPDMMIVGRQYSYGTDHPSYLTPNEQYTHVSLWAMVGSPLFIGCDLTQLDAFTRNLLANRGVIAISQDRLGKVAKRIRHVDGESVWVRPLSDGAKAVALVNRSPIAREIAVSFVEMWLGYGEYWVKDVWRQQCEGKHSGKYVVTVPPHATKLIYVRPIDCGKCENI